ncbi:MAG: imidazole glycerol phosphate synthase subunit HisH [Ruminococcaceae bacterium]|nr:imidazole glycerol phosphate synthase subunit HisH [Oscillospiraceae bacterium]
MIAIIDYGVGNLFSLSSSLEHLGLDCVITNDRETIKNAEKIILPGVGAFSDARALLKKDGLDDFLIEQAKSGKPFFGICLGMQLLFDKSFEYGVHEGLGLIKGEIRPIPTALKIPHIGWNSLNFEKDDPLLKYIKNGDYVYYVHSYCAMDCEESLVASSDYGTKVTGIVRNGNVCGTQFHPEKSGAVGLNILKAFGEM